MFFDYYGAYYDCGQREMLQVDVINKGLRLAPGDYLFWPEMWCEAKIIESRIENVSFRILDADVFGGGYGKFPWKAFWSRSR